MKDQFIIAHIVNLEYPDTVLSYSCYLSHALHKGIILLYVDDPRYRGLSVNEATPILKQLQQQLQQQGYDATYCALKGSTTKVVDLLPTQLNGVVAVAAVESEAPRRTPSHPKEVLRNYKECKIAYLTAQQPLTNSKALQQVALSIDFRKESKDKLIWSSYFARFCHSTLHLLSEDYKDVGLRQKWRNNMKFLDKFYANLNLTYTPHTIVRSGPFLDVSALNYSHQQGMGLLISVATDTRAVDFLELIIGTQEQRTIKNPHHLPVLFLNPRNDIYVLCD